jgi:fatty acid desaturase
MEGFVGRRGLIEPKRLRALSLRSDAKGFLQLGSHVGAILVTGFILHATWGTWWAVPAFIAHGVLINFLYAAQHELSHSTVFKTRRLNEIIGRVIGFLMFYPRDFDQIQHFAHHRHTQDWDKDGELDRPYYTLSGHILYVIGPTYWSSRFSRILRFAAGIVREPYIPADKHGVVIREARWLLAGYALIAAVFIALQTWAAVIFWLAPMLLTKVVHQLQNTMEHLGLSHEDNTLENTRTTRTNALLRWMAWNMQYHTAHHTYPAVPFHALPALHKEIVTRTGREPHSMTYLGFQWALIRKLAGGRSEADYPENEPWILDPAEQTRTAASHAQA